MAALDYVYQDPQETYTIEQYIACQSDEVINYKNLSFVDKIHYPELLRDFHYSAYNHRTPALSLRGQKQSRMSVQDPCLSS